MEYGAFWYIPEIVLERLDQVNVNVKQTLLLWTLKKCDLFDLTIIYNRLMELLNY